MVVYKCKMCGGNLEVQSGSSVCKCMYCDTMQTIPKTENEQTRNLFNRATRFRQQWEFDKAMEIYEQLLSTESEDAELYWSIVLCRYGIEYVDDPKTNRKIPTCHRAQYQSILDDPDYLAAISHAEDEEREIYQQEADYIAKVQRSILEISNKEAPFDVFICYKETDDQTGERTKDSVDAQEIYYQLTKENFKVFFARITLEDRLGTEYEPYIFAALNTAKVMVVLGSKPEYFNAVWVKNEWARFLTLTKVNKSKVLIPAYKNMDPYDLPQELSVLQSQDMTKIGFMQDLIHGIKKVVNADTYDKKEKSAASEKEQGSTKSIATMMKRVYIFLEDQDWGSANAYCEKVLDIDPECAEAYVGKLLVDLRLTEKKQLGGYPNDFSGNGNYKKAIRYGNTEVVTLYQNSVYMRAMNAMNAATQPEEFVAAADLFEQIKDYKNSKEMVTACDNKANQIIYDSAMALMKRRWDVLMLEGAIEKLKLIPEFKDAKKKRKECEATIKLIRRSKAIAILVVAAAFVLTCFIIYKKNTEWSPRKTYKEAVKMMKQGDYDAAYSLFEECRYDDYATQMKKCKYEQAWRWQQDGKYLESYRQFEELGDFEDSKDQMLESQYQLAFELQNQGSYDEAFTLFVKLSEVGYKDSMAQLENQSYNCVAELLQNGDYLKVLRTTNQLAVSAETAERIKVLIYQAAEEQLSQKSYQNALPLYRAAGDYLDASEKAVTCLKHAYGQKTVATGFYFTVGLYGSGRAVAIGYANDGQCDVREWRDLASIAAGGYHTLGIKRDGTVLATGRNSEGQCNVGDWTDIVMIDADETHTVGVRTDFTVVATGDNSKGKLDVAGWENIVQVAAGREHTVGLRADGTVIATGDNQYGQCNVSDWEDIIAIATGRYHTVGVKKDGTVVATGENADGECDLSDWDHITAVACGDFYTVGLKQNGTVVAKGNNYNGECDIPAWTNVVAIEAGDYHTVALRKGGSLEAIGCDNYGQCQCNNIDVMIRIPE